MKRLFSLFLLAAIIMTANAQGQIRPDGRTDSQSGSVRIDPARIYLYRHGKKAKSRFNEEETDPITQRRRENRSFIPQGNWMGGVAGGYMGTRARRTDFVFSGLKDADMYLNGFSLTPYFGYAVCNNGILGLRAGYYQASGKKDFYPCYENEELLHTYRDMDYSMDYYSGEVFFRGYVPVDKKMRFALYGEFTLGYMGGSGYLKSMRNEESFRSNFAINQIRLGFRPGMAVALCNNLSLDLSFGLANANVTFQHEKNRSGQSIKDTKARLNSLIDLTDFQLGLTFNY